MDGNEQDFRAAELMNSRQLLWRVDLWAIFRHFYFDGLKQKLKISADGKQISYFRSLNSRR